jgi:hypothetical protein
VLHLDLVMDAWYEPIRGWKRVAPWVEGLRIERNDPSYARDFEWLAKQATEELAAREKHPPVWAPLERSQPTAEDAILFLEFAQLWDGPRDAEALETVKRLAHEAPDYARFKQLAPRSSPTYTQFDRYFCMLDQAAILVRLGLLRTEMVETLGDVEWAWSVSQQWWKGMGQELGDPHLGEEIGWLVDRIHQRHAKLALAR